MAKTQKSKLAEALEKEVPPLNKDPESVIWVFDAMAVVQALVQNHFVVREWSSAKYCTKLHGLTLFVSHGYECHRISTADGQVVSECVPELGSTQEGADTEIVLHAKHASNDGHESIIVKSSDADVEALAVHFQKVIAGRVYILSCTSKRLRYVDVRAIAEELGDEICDALPRLYTFTGCDSTSALLVKGRSKHLVSSNLTKKCAQHSNILRTHLRYLLKQSLLVKSLFAYFMEVKVMVI